MVPYIDVMLVLLVIFMVTAPLLTQGVRVDLPQTQAQAIKQSDSEPLVLTVDATGRYYLNIGEDPLEPLTTEVLTTRVQAALQLEPQRRVLVRGDDSVSYGEVVHAMALLQQAGARVKKGARQGKLR